jgi:hypothetical protein
MCKSKFKVKERKRQVHGVEEEESEESDSELYVGSVGTTDAINKNELYEDVKIAKKTVNVQLDSGARCNVISIKDLQRLGINTNIKKPEAQLKSLFYHVSTKEKHTK